VACCQAANAITPHGRELAGATTGRRSSRGRRSVQYWHACPTPQRSSSEAPHRIVCAAWGSVGRRRENDSTAERRADPGDQFETPVAGMQVNDPQSNRQEPGGQLEQRASEGGIVEVRRRKAEEQQRRARAPAQQRLRAVRAILGRRWYAGTWRTAASGSAQRQARRGVLSMMRSRARRHCYRARWASVPQDAQPPAVDVRDYPPQFAFRFAIAHLGRSVRIAPYAHVFCQLKAGSLHADSCI